jgi:hypothetical protein
MAAHASMDNFLKAGLNNPVNFETGPEGPELED